MLTPALQEIVEKNLQRIYRETPLNDIIFDLHSQNVLSEGEVDTLNDYKSKQRQNYEFIKILRSRDDEDFEKYCYALSNHHSKAVKDFGNELLKKIQNPSNLDDDGDFSRAFFIASDKIGIDWPKLIAYLDVSIDTAVIRSQNPFNVFEQARQALQLWSRRYPANATAKNLIDALKNIGRNDIVFAIENSK